MLDNFSFLIEGKLAGSARPGLLDDVNDDLREAASSGITGVVTLTEEPLAADAVSAAGLTCLHLPIVDYQPPSVDQMQAAVAFIDREASAGGAVLVHCTAGRGRTGTILAAYLIHRGATAGAAMSEVRKRRFGSIETHSQEQALEVFQSHTAPGRGGSHDRACSGGS